MKRIETRGKIAEDGSIILSPGVLETMDMGIGDSICLAYLTDRTVEGANGYHEVMMTKDGIESVTEPYEPADPPELSIPHILLEAADMPLDGELNIQCAPGVIMISSADPLDAVPPCLMNLMDELGIDRSTVRKVLREGGLS